MRKRKRREAGGGEGDDAPSKEEIDTAELAANLGSGPAEEADDQADEDEDDEQWFPLCQYVSLSLRRNRTHGRSWARKKLRFGSSQLTSRVGFDLRAVLVRRHSCLTHLTSTGGFCGLSQPPAR
jgi:hypothetical protein